jgi:cytochrome c oxidase assembly protein subunit 11
MTYTKPDALRQSNRRLLVKLGVVVVVMFGFGFALVPFYDQICKATGLRDIDNPDRLENSQVDRARTVRLEFDANVRNLPWTFRPLAPVVSVHPGEVTQVVYEVENRTERPITGQAIPSYGPQLAAGYFKKLDCFCFAKQSFGPHEKRQMPVVFVVDPRLPRDVNTISLSYTFFEVEGN